MSFWIGRLGSERELRACLVFYWELVDLAVEMYVYCHSERAAWMDGWMDDGLFRRSFVVIASFRSIILLLLKLVKLV